MYSNIIELDTHVATYILQANGTTGSFKPQPLFSELAKLYGFHRHDLQ
jgi:hypothetical protein